MDNKRNTNGQPERKTTRLSLEELLFIPFYNGILTGDISKTGLTDDEFSNYTDEFFKVKGKKESSLDQQLKEKRIDIAVLTGALVTLMKGYDEDLAEIVRGYGIKISKETILDSLELIAMKIKRFHKDYKILETNKPPEPEQTEIMTAYDILANLSTNLEFGVNFKEFTVGEYLSYTKVVKSKSDSIKKLKNGRRKH